MPALRSLLFALLISTAPLAAFIEIQNGYFYDTDKQEVFLPTGIAYQVWNSNVFANQTFEQLTYDLKEMRDHGVNSLRVEMIWGEIEATKGQFDFTNADYLVQQAEALGLKLFVLIGTQYPPSWAEADGLMATHIESGGASTGTSLILNYSNPAAQAAHANFISTVCDRYKDSKAIAGWIVGNEFAFYDLWETTDEHRFVGYDTAYSLPSYRAFLEARYTDIASLNSAWGSSYGAFTDVLMATSFPTDREDQATIRSSGYHDLIQWRKEVIGDFLASTVTAARQADPNHLFTYSQVGGIFSGTDANISCEDAATILQRCELAGAPLDFWTINNYPWMLTGSEMSSVDFGIAKYRDTLGVPVMISETGISSNDNLFSESADRYNRGLEGTVWEALHAGAIGVHVFHWSDRNGFLSTGFPREAGFGLLTEDRLHKSDVFERVMGAYRRMREIGFGDLLVASQAADPDVLVYQSADGDLGFNRFNQEAAMLWNAFRRLGLKPRLIDDAAYDRLTDGNPGNDGTLGSAAALCLPRNYKMEAARLTALEDVLVAGGLHVHASADLPGRFDSLHRSNPEWVSRMDSLFGLDVSGAVPGQDGFAGVEGAWPAGYENVQLALTNPLAPLVVGPDDSLHFGTWKLWHGLGVGSQGTTIYTHRGVGDAAGVQPGLRVVSGTGGAGNRAVNTYALGDIINFFGDGNAAEHPWRVRHLTLDAIYRNHFGMSPTIALSTAGGAGDAAYVSTDYRNLSNGSTLIAVHNRQNAAVDVTLDSTTLLAGRKVEDLSQAALLNVSGNEVTLSLAPDAFVLLYSYTTDGSSDTSLVNSAPAKVWMEAAPWRVWPSEESYAVDVAYDTQGANLDLRVVFEQVDGGTVVRSQSSTVAVSGAGTSQLSLNIPDANLSDSAYASSRNGGEYRVSAWLESGGIVSSQTSVPVQLLFGARPTAALPTELFSGQTYQIELAWEDLPSYIAAEDNSLLERADVWPAVGDNTVEAYGLVLELLDDQGAVLASDSATTSTGNGTHTFSIVAPSNLAAGSFSFRARFEGQQTASDLLESFEGLALGNTNTGGLDMAPWTVADGGDRQWFEHGVSETSASDGSKSIYTVFQSHQPGGWSYFAIERYLDSPVNVTDPASATLRYDFLEQNGRACNLVVQAIDSAGNVGEFTQTYSGSTTTFDTITITMDQLQESPHDAGGDFDPSSFARIVCLITMLEEDQTYVGFFDNVQVTGLPATTGGNRTLVYASANDGSGNGDYTDWQNAQFTPGEIADPAAPTGSSEDFDGDGYNNFLEFALGLDPKQRGGVDTGAEMPSLQTSASLASIRFARNDSATSLTYEVQASSDLTNWAVLARSTNGDPFVKVDAACELVSNPDSTGLVVVEVRDSQAIGAAPRFLRVYVTD